MANKSLDDIWGTPDTEQVESEETNVEMEQGKSLDDIWTTQTEQPTSVPQQEPPMPTTGEDEGGGFWSDAWASIKSGAISGVAGILQTFDMMGTNSLQRRIRDYETGPEADRGREAAKAAEEAAQRLRDMGYAGYAGFVTKYSPTTESSPVEKKADELRKKAFEIGPDVEMDIVESFARGDISGGTYKLAMGLFNTSPQIIAMLGTSMVGSPAAGLGMIGASTTGSKYQEVKNREDLTESQKKGIAVVHGLLEVTAEKLGSMKLIEDIVNNRATRKALQSTAAQLAAKFIGTEAGEEFVTSLGQDFADKVLGVEPDLTGYQMGMNSLNSLVLGAGMGTTLAGLKLTMPKSNTNTDVEASESTATDTTNEGDVLPENNIEEFKQNVSQKIVETYNYDESRTADIKQTMDFADKYGQMYNVSPDIIAGLMKIESDFTNVENDRSSALGPLQITDAGLEDLARVGVQLHNPISTLEGRVEAGIRYFKMLRDHYGFEGDELIAAYFSGPTYVRSNGITDTVIADQISNREYVRRFKEAHSKLINMEHTELAEAEVEAEPTEDTVAATDEEVVVEETETQEPIKAGLDDVTMIQRSLNSLGYETTETGELDMDTLSSLTQFQSDFGLDWDTTNSPDDVVLDDQFKETIKQELAKTEDTDLLNEIQSQEDEANVAEEIDDTQAAVNVAQPTQRGDAGDYWANYKQYLKDVQGRKAIENDPEAEMPNRVEVERRDTSDLEEQIDWYLNQDMQTNASEAHQLESLTKPSEGDSINTFRILENPKILKGIKLMADLEHDDTVQSHAELESNVQDMIGYKTVDEMVAKLGMVKDNARTLSKAVQEAPETVLALRKMVVSNAKSLQSLARDIKQSEGTESKLKMYQFLDHLQLQRTLTGDLKNIQKQVARTLSQGQIYVDGNSVNLRDMVPGQLDSGAVEELKRRLDAVGGDEGIMDLVDEVIDGDISKVSEVSREPNSKRIMKALIELRATNLFKSVFTHMRNISSQLLNVVGETGSNFTAATVNLVRRNGAQDTLAEANSERGMTYTEAVKRVVGNISGVYQAMFKPLVSMKDVAALENGGSKPSVFELMLLAITDTTEFENLFERAQLDTRMEVEGITRHRISSDYLFSGDFKDNTTLGKIISPVLDRTGAALRLTSFGALQLGDKPFTYAGYNSELAGQLHLLKKTTKLKNMNRSERNEYLRKVREASMAMRQVKTVSDLIQERAVNEAAAQGISVEEARARIETEFTEGALDVSEDILQDAQLIDEAAMKHASKMTWKDPFEEGTVSRWLEKGMANHPTLKVIFPVFHTPMKILQKGWNYSNPLAKQMRGDLSGKNGKRAQTQALGRLAVSGMLFTWGAMLVGAGQLTPPARDGEERRRMELAGIQPHSIKIGDKWYDYNQMDPFPAYFFTSIASGYRAIYEAMEDPNATDDEKVIKAAGGAFWDIVRGTLDKTMFTEIRRIVNAVNYGGTSYGQALLDTMVPTYTFSRNINDVNWFGRNPFYEEYSIDDDNGFVRRDMFGKPLMNYEMFVTGSRVTEESDSPVRQELFDLGLTLPGMRNTFNGVELTDEQYNNLLRFFDERMQAEDKMNDLVESSSYRRANSDQKVKMIRDRWETLKAQAKSTLYENREYVEQYLEYQKEQQRQQMLGGDYKYNFFRQGEPMKIDAESFWDLLKNMGNDTETEGE